MVIIKSKIIFANERQWKNWSFTPRGRVNIFLEVKVVLKTHKYCFLKAFVNGLVSQILNNNITDFTWNYVNHCHADDIAVFFFQMRLYAIKFQTAVNFSALSTVRIKAAL